MIGGTQHRSFHASGMSSPDANARPRTKERSPAWRVRPDCGNFGGVLHRWIGIGLLVLLVPIAVSGALLVYHDEFDALVNPKRWTVSGPQLALSPAQYIAAASAVVAANETVTGVRFPRSAGAPVVVLARQQVDPASGRRPRFFSIYLDPPTGAVLDKVDFRASWVGFLHVFHENLTIPAIFRTPDRRMGRRRDARSFRSPASGCGGRVAASVLSAPSVAARAAHVDKSAPHARLLDFDTARDRLADRNLSVVPADGALADVVDRSHAAAAAARVRRGDRREAQSDRRMKRCASRKRSSRQRGRPRCFCRPSPIAGRRPKAAKAARAPNAGRPKRVARHARAARKAARDAKRRRGARHHRRRGACNCAIPPAT